MKKTFRRFGPPAGLALALLFMVSCDGDPAGPGDASTDRVNDLMVTYSAATESAELTWTSPSLTSGPASEYEIRYSYGPLVWDLSVPVDDPPTPAAPGTQQSYSFASPLRGRDIYFAIRVSDAAGNQMKSSASASVRVPGFSLSLRCVDVYSRAPAEGLTVTVTTTTVATQATDANGEAHFNDVASGTAVISVSGTNGSAVYHRIRDPFVIGNSVTREYAMIPVEPTSFASFDNILRMFITAAFAGQTRILKKYDALPVPLHAPPFVNSSGVDYQARAYAAAQQWMDRTGVPLYTFVDAPPDTGVVFRFLSRESISPLVGITEHINGADGNPIGEIVKVVNDYPDADVLTPLLLHELGHTIRLQHLPLGSLMYGGRPIPGDPTDDEVRVVQLHAGLANGTDITIYDVE